MRLEKFSSLFFFLGMIKGDLNLTCDTLDFNEWMPPRETATGKPVPTADTTHSKTYRD